ncbi:MAG: hypothetical protein DRJ31_07645 [Candidatus Methanomethylicota archaeon]|uniref:HEPN domain-containing protein n=1 Tax=Thermoproteota archaeon TaxID=2056631 RepID=A0A497ELW0_9CREN|nr:MAG: hypothetical protein DRJ31_07645 [Candidatus Verstraetearchaeota archaeon]
MIKNSKFRSAYIFLFDAVERILDIWAIEHKKVKPTTRKEREELMFKCLPWSTLKKFKSFYYERRGGMYEDFLLVTRNDVKALIKFFVKLREER